MPLGPSDWIKKLVDTKPVTPAVPVVPPVVEKKVEAPLPVKPVAPVVEKPIEAPTIPVAAPVAAPLTATPPSVVK